MRLSTYLRQHYVVRRDVKTSSIRKYTYSVRRFDEFLGRPAKLSDCTAGNLSAFTLARQNHVNPKTGQRIKDRTARNDRDNLICLIKAAVDDGLSKLPGHVRRPKCKPVIPVAWTPEEMLRLREATAAMKKPLWWRTLLDVAYDTGLRCSDVLTFDMSRLADDGTATIVQEKVNRRHTVWLSSESIEGLRALGGRFPFRLRRPTKEYYAGWKQLREAAGLEHGATQQIRRTAATQVEIATPGAATEFLGHVTTGLARKSYIDPRLASPRSIAPPTGWRDAHGKPATTARSDPGGGGLRSA